MRGGISFSGLLIIGGILYFTNAGSWLWTKIRELPNGCYAMVQGTMLSSADAMCAGLSRMIDAADEGMAGLGQKVKEEVSQQGGQAAMDLRGYADTVLQRIAPNGTLGTIISPADTLRAMMQQQPYTLPSLADASERLRLASDQFVIGQFYLQDKSPMQAVQWFSQSAAQPGGYGILSQLTLADIYRKGSYGVAPNPLAARQYYESARQSLATLQTANTPESKQLLGSLPAAPQQLQGQLEAQLMRMR